MTEEPEVWGTWAVGGIKQARVSPANTPRQLVCLLQQIRLVS